MADRKITDLTALTTPASADVLPIVDVSEAAAADKNKKITVGELFKGVPDGSAAAPAIAFETDDGNGLFLSTTDTIGIATNGVSRATVSTTAVTSTLPVIVPDGSAAAPSVAFTGSGTDTGLYSPGADQVAISTGGTGRLFVDSSGNVGIKTGSPSVPLEIARLGTAWAGVSPIAGTALFVNSGSSSTTAPTRVSILSGNAASAAIYFGDTDNSSEGIIQLDNTDDSLQFTVNGSERLRITSDGKVGLGTSSPAALLHLSSGANTTMRLTDTAGSYSDIIYNESASVSQLILDADPTGSSVATGGTSILLKTDGTTAMTIDSSQRVGIGTTSPDNKLHIFAGDSSGSSHASAQLTIENSGNSALQFLAGTSSSSEIRFGDSGDNGAGSIAYVHSDNSLRFGTNNGTEKARIDSSGRLLVGTSTARGNFFNSTNTAALQVEGNTNNTAAIAVIQDYNADTQGAQLILAKSNSQTIGSNTLVASGDNLGIISFQGSDGTEFVEAAYILAEVDGTPGTNDMPGRLVFSTTADGASSPTERMRITQAGAVGINSPAAYNVALNIKSFTNNGAVEFYHHSNNASVGLISTSTTATTYATSSDYRLKENVVPLTGAIDRVNQLQVHRFNFFVDPDKTVDGFLAHEAQAVVPECVTGVKDEVDAAGNPVYQGIDQSKLVPLLTAALQEALAEIESLKARVTALEP